ncbi:3-deoxy-D-manno-octulosonic acid transferase [bacterium]|nr:3-deoxy-D-manno-octulosonic acid transferase [bacterium]
MLNAAYVALLTAVSPLLVYRALTQGKYRTGWREKLLGRVPDLSPVGAGAERYWFHAVSVGEVLLLRSVLTELRRREPTAEVVISTTTSTGHAVARETFPDTIVCYFPLDFTWAVAAAIQRLKPTRFVLVELELWPNILAAVVRAGVSLSLINGRLSEHSFRGYSKLKWLLRPVLRSFDQIAVQNDAYAERFRALGAPPERVIVTGSVKFDGLETRRDNDRTQSLREAFGLEPGERVFIAGSTQSPEEEIAITAWQRVREVAPKLRLILVPRHKERFDEVAELVVAHGLPLRRRSTTTGNAANAAASIVTPADNRGDRLVLLLDTLGELSACWGLADFAFVGGSLTNRGGQNMIEPAGYGAAVCFGPNTRNFRDTVEALLACDGATVVTDAESLAATLEHWLADPAAAAAMGQRAQQFVASQRGATERALDCLCDEEPTSALHRAA